MVVWPCASLQLASVWTAACRVPSVHRTSQARVPEQIAISFSRGSSQLMRGPVSPAAAGGLYHGASRQGPDHALHYLNVHGNRSIQNVCSEKYICPCTHEQHENICQKYNLLLVQPHKWSQHQQLFLFVNLLKASAQSSS